MKWCHDPEKFVSPNNISSIGVFIIQLTKFLLFIFIQTFVYTVFMQFLEFILFAHCSKHKGFTTSM